MQSNGERGGWLWFRMQAEKWNGSLSSSRAVTRKFAGTQCHVTETVRKIPEASNNLVKEMFESTKVYAVPLRPLFICSNFGPVFRARESQTTAWVAELALCRPLCRSFPKLSRVAPPFESSAVLTEELRHEID